MGDREATASANSKHHVRGGCLCGDVGFELKLPSLWCAHCHCSLCRRAHGAAFVTWVGFSTDTSVIVDPDEVLHWFASSPDSERGFCRHCGSTMFFRSERWPGELHVALANIDGDIDREPQAHVHWESHVDWCAVGDELEKKSSTS